MPPQGPECAARVGAGGDNTTVVHRFPGLFPGFQFPPKPKSALCAWAIPMPEDKDIRVIQVSETHILKLLSRRDASFTGGSAIGPESEVDVALATICGDLNNP